MITYWKDASAAALAWNLIFSKSDLGLSAWENFRTAFTDLFRLLQQEMAVTN